MQLRNQMYLEGIAGLTASSILLIGSFAFAQSTATPPPSGQSGWGMHGGRGMGMRPGVFGTVASISGDTLTVTSQGRPMAQGTTPTPTTFMVDATNATVTKDNAASTIGAVAVGDMVMVQGTVTGTNVAATKIMDGKMGMGKGGWGMGSSTRPQLNSIIKGNGQPVIGGSVSAVSSDTLTVTTAEGGQTYTVDATNATIEKDNATSSVSAIAVGDKVVAQGSVNGTAVTASSVIDSGTMSQTAGVQGAMPHPRTGGFFGAIGGFFQHLFGFF
jgi:hypothetical protein